MTVRCDQCGHESDARYRFCGMCGAKLPPPPPAREIPPPPPREETVRPVSGPSFLGLADEPASSVTYLLEDELSESHWGRTLVLLIFLVAIAAAGWHWRSNVRAYVTAHLAEHPNNPQVEATPPAEPAAVPPVSTSASEVAPAVPAAPPGTDKPKTGAGDVNSLPNPPAAAPGSSPAAPPTAEAQQNPAPAANASAATQAPQPSSKSDQAENGGAEAAKTETPAAESGVSKHAKAHEAPPPADASEQLEASGERYLYGTGGAADCNRAQRDLAAAAEQGNSKADSVLGTMYATGHCVSHDLPLAYRWFARALQQDPSNSRLQRDLQVLWGQMSPDERQIAMRSQP
jgi:hypothetical protein